MTPVICISAYDISAFFFVIGVVVLAVTFSHMTLHLCRLRNESQARVAAGYGASGERALQNSLRNTAWMTGIIAAAFFFGGLAVAVAVLIDALKV